MIAATALTMACHLPSIVLATDTDPNSDPSTEVISQIENAKTLIYSIGGGLGALVFFFSLFSALKARKNGNDEKFDNGITGCIIGIVMASAGALMAYFGF